jgi:hypothetical protein
MAEDTYKYFKSWQRLESRCRENDFDEGLEARTADPLWFLSRQWQMGEFQAENAGSIIDVEINYRSQKISRYQLGEEEFSDLGSLSPPMEALVEREPIEWDWRGRIRAGQQFARIFGEEARKQNVSGDDIEDFIQSLFTIEDLKIDQPEEDSQDRSTLRLLKVFAGKAINGEALWLKFTQDNFTDPNQNIDQNIIDESSRQFLEWYDELFCQTDEEYNHAWQPKTLDYHYAVSTPITEGVETIITSTQYRNGDLEWYSGNLLQETEAEENYATEESYGLPGRVNYGGMPLPRWWAMEDYAINFGNMDVGTPDLIKTILAEFALVYGDDWFLVPLTLGLGTVTHIESIVTTDVFGFTQEITSARENNEDPLKRWDLYSLSSQDDSTANAEGDFLYLPYSTGYREESAPVEEVRFIRDEGANMVWGVEKTVPNSWGKPVEAFDLQAEKYQNPAATINPLDENPKHAKLKYKLITPVPENWIPFIPVKQDTNDQIILQQAEMPTQDGSESIEPVSRILGSNFNGSELINEEAITRAGVKVQLTKQRVRWVDGKTYVWLGRKAVTGKGEGSSGLRFDNAAKDIVEKGVA